MGWAPRENPTEQGASKGFVERTEAPGKRRKERTGQEKGYLGRHEPSGRGWTVRPACV